MNLNLKFRAWDKINKEIHVIFEIDYRYGTVGLKHDLSYEYYADMEDVELMQYTGIKDKNDKEIYVGDIVSGSYVEDDYYKHHIKGKVEFFNGAFTIESNTESFDFFNLFDGQRISKLELEVVGNIYENPELIKESK